jgi:CHAT domain-containing protein/uncharacterized protein HemY
MTPPKFGLFNSSFWTISSTAMPRLFFVSFALALALTPVEPTTAQPTDSLAADSTAIIDSLQAALDRFEAADPPTARDSTRLRRWADSLQAKGGSLRRSKPSEAREHLQEAIRGYKVLSDSSGLSEAIRNIGITHLYQFEDTKAVERFREAIQIARAFDDRKAIANALNVIGIVHWRHERYEDSIRHFRKTLQIMQEIGYHENIPSILNNIATIHGDQGQYKEALHLYRKALQKIRNYGNQRGAAEALNNIGNVYKEKGQYEKAIDRYQKSLEIKRKYGNRKGVAASLGNIGTVYRIQGKYEKALTYYRESLQIEQHIGNLRGVSTSNRNIGFIYAKQGRYEDALVQYRNALRIDKEVGDRFGILASLTKIGTVQLETARIQTATETLGRAVRLSDELRLSAISPEARRSLLSTQIGAYRALTTAHVRSDRPDSALRTVEQARARLLADRLAGTATGDTAFALPSVTELRRTLDQDEAALLYANAESEWPLTALVVTEDTTVARELPDSTALAAIESEYPTQLNRLRREKGPLTAALDQNTSSGQGDTPSLAEIVRLYRYYLTRGETGDSIRDDLARRLHGLLVEPVADAIADKSELIAAPTGALGYLPVETLRNSSGQYLIEDTHVRYAQSLTVLRQLRDREYPERTRPLLAMGGAAYRAEGADEADGNVLAEARRGSTRVRTRGHAATLLRDAERRIEQGRSPRAIYEQLGYGAWSPLPATEGEVRRLGRIAGTRARTVTGQGASESLIRSMSADGRLRQYRRVHLATHGIAVPEAPELSALVLSQVGASDSLAATDGYLTMEEIADLDLRADVAVLSACQTGLGKIVAGEGVVSLSHAFLRAGANATLVSQWKVLDESTRRFMTAVYKRSEKAGTSFAEAVTETKRAFIAGEHGAKNTDPLRWAPFVYYGRE